MILMSGQASYYSKAGCLGCSKTFTMANGEVLDDGKLTIAMTPAIVRKYKLLNKQVVIANPKTGMSVVTKVTDTGGFAKYNRVADMTIATRDAIKCNNLCDIQILIIK